MLGEVLGLLMFWPFFAGVILFLVICTFVDNDRAILPGVLIAVFLGVLHFTGQWSIIENLNIDTLFIMLGYLFIGVLYSGAKWFAKLLKHKKEYNIVIKKCKEAHPQLFNEDGSIHQIQSVREYIYTNSSVLNRSQNGSVIPQIRHYRSEFTCWLLYWPFSILSSIVTNGINAIFGLFKGGFQKVSNLVFKDIPEELK